MWANLKHEPNPYIELLSCCNCQNLAKLHVAPTFESVGKIKSDHSNESYEAVSPCGTNLLYSTRRFLLQQIEVSRKNSRSSFVEYQCLYLVFFFIKEEIPHEPQIFILPT